MICFLWRVGSKTLTLCFRLVVPKMENEKCRQFSKEIILSLLQYSKLRDWSEGICKLVHLCEYCFCYIDQHSNWWQRWVLNCFRLKNGCMWNKLESPHSRSQWPLYHNLRNKHLQQRHLVQPIPLLCHTEMGSSVLLSTSFSALCCNWFSQLHFHLSVTLQPKTEHLSSCDCELWPVTQPLTFT